MTNFAQKLNDLLAEQPERPVDIAKRAGITQDELTKYKSGKRFPTQREKVTSLLMAIRCSITVREEVKNIWEREYLAKKYKEEDAWKCIKEIYQFFQSESLVYDQNSCVKVGKIYFGGGRIKQRIKYKKIFGIFSLQSSRR